MSEQSVLGKVLNQKYRLVAELGHGAMGVVYRAEQLDVEGQVQRLVALKTMKAELSANPDFARRFLQEIRVTMTLNHPHIITVYDSGRDETGQLYYTMKLVQGQTLRELLRQEGTLPVERVTHITDHICEALSEAHHLAEPIIHRDLKPENIFLAQRQGKDWVKIGDFGIAKVLGENTGGLTHTGMSPGTPRYMAPEQCLGKAVDSRTDLYALGIMMYEMLVGHTPFTADNLYALLRKHIEEPPPPLPTSIPIGIRSQVEQLLAKAPQERPADALSVRHTSENGSQEESEPSTVILAFQESQAPQPSPPATTSTPPLGNDSRLLSGFVGRERELEQLQRWYEKALQGERQVVFVTGEPGMGKTTVVEAFLKRIATDGKSWIARGQCVAQYGAGEAYLPILEALGQLGRASAGNRLHAILHRQAPSWLVQLPSLVNDTELDELQRKVQGVTKERMLRELAEALEVLTSDQPLVLVLEDLHWCDHATLDLLTYLAQRRQPACILVIGTYRPTDVAVSGHPLMGIKQELQAHKQCEELRLALLTEPEVTTYIEQRFPTIAITSTLGHVVHERTDGNALFMVNMVEELIKQGVIVEEAGRWELRGDIAHISVPDTLRQLIEKQLGQLSEDEQRVLEVASVVGMDFPVTAVAAGLKQDTDTVEEVCEELAKQGQFLEEREVVQWSDGTLSGRYSFRHTLYLHVLYDHIAQARRVRLHRQIGERLEAGYGEQSKEFAAELAVHFEQGRDFPRAIQYREHAGKIAVQRSAHREAITHFTKAKGLELLKTLPDTPERTQQELTLQMALGAPLMATRGYTVPEVERAYTRALELCRHMGETPQLFPVLGGLSSFYGMRGELQAARELSEQRMRLAQSIRDPAFLLDAYRTLGMAFFWLGKFTSAQAHLEQSIALYDSQQHSSPSFLSLQEPKVHCLSFRAWTLWFLGYPDQALAKISEALALTGDFPHSYTKAWTLIPSAEIHQHRREEQLTLERAEAAVALSTNLGFPPILAMGTILQGWALAEQGQGEEGIVQIRRGITAEQTTGVELQRPYGLALLAEAYRKVEQIVAGLTVLAEALALVNKNGERWWEAELYRLKGELTLQKSLVVSRQLSVTDPQPLNPNPQDEAEECFLKAIEIAQKQEAKSLELRATVSLARLWQQQGKHQEARSALAEIYNWFTEGFDTKDLQEAKTLLEELS